MEPSQLKKESLVLIPSCLVAKSFFSRFMGLMGKKGISSDEAVFFPNCNSIHTFFMRFPIDVVLLDKNKTVVEVIGSMREWQMMAPRSKVKHVVEMRANRIGELGIKVGDVLQCDGA